MGASDLDNLATNHSSTVVLLHSSHLQATGVYCEKMHAVLDGYSDMVVKAVIYSSSSSTSKPQVMHFFTGIPVSGLSSSRPKS
jgi:hypothetical protein